MSKLAAITLALIASMAVAEEIPRTITVSGQGKVSSVPDMATINAGVSSFAKSAKAALAANNQAMQTVMQTLKQRGVAQKDIQTSGFNVYPEYVRDPSPRGTTKANQVAGYRVSNTVLVKVRDLPKLGGILDALIQSGSNQISGVQFSFADPQSLINDARREAVADARSRAELYAAATGVKVGDVIAISEQAINAPQHAMVRMASMDMSAPISQGEQNVTAAINIVYKLE